MLKILSKSLLIKLASFVFLTSQAHAGAWLQEEGRGEAIINYTYFNSDDSYNQFGDKVSGNAFGKNELNPYFEYGLDEDLTIGTSISLQSVSANGSASIADADNLNMSYIDLFARTYLVENDKYVVSIEPRLHIPVDEDASLNPEGDDIIPELKLAFGMPFQIPFEIPFTEISDHYHFVDLGATYRKRDKDSFDRNLRDMLKVEATAGFRYDEETLALFQVFHEVSLGRKSGDVTSGNFDLTKLQLSVAYEYWENIFLQAGAFTNIDGVNTSAGDGLLFSVWYKF